MTHLNETHDPKLKSWVAAANAAGSDFPIQNLPFGVFRHKGSSEAWRCGVAIGDQILDLAAAQSAFEGDAAIAAAACAGGTLNAFMAMEPKYWSALRLALSRALREGAAATLEPHLIRQVEARHALPAAIADFTDFYASIHHATTVGKMFRPDSPLMPNYKWVPIAYHGRSSSIRVSGQRFARPMGQTKAPDAEAPSFGPCKRLDYELELGIFIGQGNELGQRIPLAEAESHVFGLCVLNDWSARDIQGWEYQPLGPFLSKNFASTVSPWIVTLEALAPHRLAWTRPQDDPQPLPYLDSAALREEGAFDIELEVFIQSADMRTQGLPPHRLSRSNFKHAYWSVSQMVAHHTINGCDLQPGDLLGSGTQSGPTLEEAGALIELTVGGTKPFTLPSGESRTFLQDGDTIIFRGASERPGAARIGFGEVAGTLLPARRSV